MSSWQSRLSAVENRLSQKLIDNSIDLTGSATDVIMINEDLNELQDVTSYNVESIGIVNIIFPEMKDIPTWRFLNTGSTSAIIANDEKENEPIVCISPISQIIDQGSLLLKFLENNKNDMPWVLVLRVADVNIDFGARTSITKKIICTYYDQPINSQLLNWLNIFATRRQLLQW